MPTGPPPTTTSGSGVVSVLENESIVASVSCQSSCKEAGVAGTGFSRDMQSQPVPLAGSDERR
jgi:hypothetical protein